MPVAAPIRRFGRAIGIIVAALVAATSVGAIAPASVRAASPLKAVIIVGPSGSSQQAGNLADGEEIARTAESYGMDVRRVFHPRATWSRVLANIQDASIVAYLGHGNGWPSPYAPFQTLTKDGFGLNPYDGAGPNETKYYGEGPIGDNIRLAPNAVVLLNHLCYASGNSEPGHAAPTVTVARERVDNYGAGFLRSGAGAVFAYGIQDVSDVVDALFTTNSTMDEIFMGRGYIGGRDIRFSSVRTPGNSVHMDPASATTFYRSVIGDLQMKASEVVGPPPPTDGTPSTFVVPGAASVVADVPAPIYDAPGGMEIGVLDPTTAVRIAEGPVTAAGGQWFRVTSPLAGWMRQETLKPEDSTPPRVDDLDPELGWFSPNGDGVNDTMPVTATFSEAGSWFIRFQRTDGTNLRNYYGTGTSVTRAWNGTTGVDTPVPDGQYRVAAQSTDAWGNVGSYRYGTVWIDTVAPTISGVAARLVTGTTARTPTGQTIALVTPNGDGFMDTVALDWSSSQAGTALVSVAGAGGVVRSFSASAPAGTGSTTWNGRTDAGGAAPDGVYTVTIQVRDPAGNLSGLGTTKVLVHTALRAVSHGPVNFYNRDGDALVPATTLRFTLAQAASVDSRLVDPAGVAVRTRWRSAALGAGSYAWSWDGRTATGTFARDAKYVMSVTAVTAAGSVQHRFGTYNSAFRILPAATSVSRGTATTVTLVSAEPLAKNPTLLVTQPGLAPYTVATTKTATNTYRASWTLRTGGTTGTATLRPAGTDTGGQWQATYGSLTIK